jgi:hypothetical protein
MKSTKADVYFGWLLNAVLFLCEWAGIQVAIFTPHAHLPIALFVLWILVQGAVSFFLLSQAWHAARARKKEAWRMFNIAIICIVLQGLGVFQSLQLFAGTAAIADGFLLYLMYHWG